MSPALDEDGVTLVELLVSLALTGLVMGLTVPFAHVQKRIWTRHEERREAVRALAGALSWLARDLQQAGYHDLGSPVRLVEPEKLVYVLSRDEDDPAGFKPANRRLVTTWLDGRDLKYKTQAPLPPPETGWERGSTQVLVSGITGLRCRGLDGGGDETTEPARTSFVECTVSGASGMRERLLVRLRSGGLGAAP